MSSHMQAKEHSQIIAWDNSCKVWLDADSIGHGCPFGERPVHKLRKRRMYICPIPECSEAWVKREDFILHMKHDHDMEAK